MLDTRVYDVMFSDGTIKPYLANTITESMYIQVDAGGNTMAYLESVTDHRRNETTIRITDFNNSTKFTTKVWFLKVQWKDGTDQCLPLKDLKESNAVATLEYTLANELMSDPDFK